MVEAVTTPLVRAAFVEGLFDPKKQENGSLKYQATLLYPKGTDESALKKAVIAAGQEKWPGGQFEKLVSNKIVRLPFLDGDGPEGVNKRTGERLNGYAGQSFIRVQSGEKFPPKLFDKNNMPGTRDTVYSGVYGMALIVPFGWENDKGGKGISFSISAFRVIKDGERLGGGASVNVDDWLATLPQVDHGAGMGGVKGAADLFS